MLPPRLLILVAFRYLEEEMADTAIGLFGKRRVGRNRVLAARRLPGGLGLLREPVPAVAVEVEDVV